MRSIVVDTGPLVAWFDPDDKHHHRAERWLKRHGASFKRYTTLAVLTEALHLIDSAAAGAALLEWIAAGGMVIVAVENADLRAISVRDSFKHLIAAGRRAHHGTSSGIRSRPLRR